MQHELGANVERQAECGFQGNGIAALIDAQVPGPACGLMSGEHRQSVEECPPRHERPKGMSGAGESWKDKSLVVPPVRNGRNCGSGAP